MRLSRKTDYGIILLKSLTPTFKNGEFLSLPKIAKENNLPQVFLGKLAEILRHKGYLGSKRGAEGGYRLLKNPQRITFQEIIDALEESSMMRCLGVGDPQERCHQVNICPTNKDWKEIHSKITKEFKKITLGKI